MTETQLPTVRRRGGGEGGGEGQPEQPHSLILKMAIRKLKGMKQPEKPVGHHGAIALWTRARASSSGGDNLFSWSPLANPFVIPAADLAGTLRWTVSTLQLQLEGRSHTPSLTSF
jgi:hypothetical protein